MRRPIAHSDTGCWRLGDVDLAEYLNRYLGKRLVLTIARGQRVAGQFTSDIGGFVMNEFGEYRRCKLAIEAVDRDAQASETQAHFP